jgi:hypothetical protein
MKLDAVEDGLRRYRKEQHDVRKAQWFYIGRRTELSHGP